MGSHVLHTCTRCGSVDVKCGTNTCKCQNCGHMGPKRKFAKYHGSTACDVPMDSQSVPKRNLRRQPGQKKVWRPGDD